MSLLGGFYSSKGLYCCAPRNHPQKQSGHRAGTACVYQNQKACPGEKLLSLLWQRRTKNAEELAKRTGIELMCPDELIELPMLAPSEDELRAAMKEEEKKERPTLKRSAAVGGKYTHLYAGGSGAYRMVCHIQKFHCLSSDCCMYDVFGGSVLSGRA